MESTTINNEKKRIRHNLYKKEAIYNFLKEKDRLTNK